MAQKGRKNQPEGWLRRKERKNITLFCYYDGDGVERCKTIGPFAMSDKQAWGKVRELGLDKLVGVKTTKAKPLTFGEMATKYLAKHPFKKTSTKELHTQIIQNVLMPKWGDVPAIEIESPKLEDWMIDLDVATSTRGKYRAVMSAVYNWGRRRKLITEFLAQKDGGFISSNPCSTIKGDDFSQITEYEAMAVDPLDIFAMLSELPQPEREITLVVVFCQLRISEALGLKWENILWESGKIAIRQTFVHSNIQSGAKTKKSRSKVEAPKIVLDALAAWRKETLYSADDDFVFASVKLSGKQPRSASMLVEDYIRPAAIKAGIITVKNGATYNRENEVVSRFGFHVLGRHSIATWMMENQENPAVVQAIGRWSKMDMVAHYSHAHGKNKLAAREKLVDLIPENLRVLLAGTQSETVQ
jgi:integrase